MKTTALIAAVALTAAAGFAQAANDTDTTTHRTRPAAMQKDKDVKVEKTDKTASGETLGEKTKHAFQTMGQKIRSAGHRIAASTKKDKSDDTRHVARKDDARNDTRSMGASRDTTK
jgi:hypothetical protein